MKKQLKKLIFLLVCAFNVYQPCYSNNSDKLKKVEVTYIANDGFLIKVNDKQILIDALFGDIEYGFCDIPSEETLESMMKLEGTFNNIDLIAATHRHIDHFYAPFVFEHLRKNTKGEFISCEQSIDELKELENYSVIKNQLVEITPDSIFYIDTTLSNIEIRIYRLSHGPYYEEDPVTGKKINRHQNIQNIGFLFNIDGVKIFHCGDSNPDGITDYQHFRLDNENIDIAFLDWGFMWQSDCPGIEILKNYINPKHIVLMHIHHDDNERFIEVAKKIQNDFPSVKIFENEMETKRYVIE